jgi:hypothetical protein
LNRFLTPLGAANPLKDALLARYQLVRNAFNQTAFIESLNLSPQVLADIWLPVGFAPVSFEPLSEEEEKASSTGQFGNLNARNGPGRGNYVSPGGSGSGGDNNYRRGHTANSNYSPANRRPRTNSSFTANGANSRNNPNQHQNYRQDHHQDDDTIEDPDNLWATPSQDTMGASDFGSFDENGIFKAGGGSLGALEDFTAASATFDGFMQGRPSQQTQPPAQAQTQQQQLPIEVTSSQPTSSIAIPLITADTQWLYRDPSGQIQGPFPSHRMIEWYNGKYFPENLPLRREQDPFFEPLSTWKSKCAGQIPFIAYTTVKASNPIPSATASNPIPSPVAVKVETKKQFNNTTESSSFNPASQTNTSRTTNLPLENLFSPTKKPTSPDVLMPVSGWKKLETPSSSSAQVSSEFGQLNLNIETKPTKATEVPIEESPKLQAIAKPTTSTNTTPSWSNNAASSSTGSLKKISLSEILMTQQAEEPEKKTTPVSSSPSDAGWAKLSSSPVQSLSKIQSEEEIIKQQQQPSATSSSSASKSFADLVRSAGTITTGNIVVSPISTSTPPLTEKKTIKPSPIITKPQPQAKPVQSTQTSTATATTTAVPSVNDWCLNTLKQSGPLSKAIDPQTCTILLLDLPNPSALYSFALETLKPLLTAQDASSFDLAAFAHELSTKKFGAKATEKIQWTKLKISPQSESSRHQEESFEVVKRKK